MAASDAAVSWRRVHLGCRKIQLCFNRRICVEVPNVLACGYRPSSIGAQAALSVGQIVTGPTALAGRSPADLREKYSEFSWTAVRPSIADGLRCLSIAQEGKLWISNLYCHVFSQAHRHRVADTKSYSLESMMLRRITRAGRFAGRNRRGLSAIGWGGCADGANHAGPRWGGVVQLARRATKSIVHCDQTSPRQATTLGRAFC